MNKTHIYTKYTGVRSQFRLLLLLMAGIFASCTQDGAGIATPLEVSAEIGNPQTRADDPHLSDYDKKKFVTDDVIKISKGATDVNYKRTAAGGWAPSVSTTPMTTTGGETFTATFPNDFSSILADQSTPTNFWKSNRLTATATATGNRVSFSFAPAACKITIIVSFQVDNSSGSAKVAGKGLCSGNKTTEETITLLKTSEAVRRHTYSGIFSPDAATSYLISVTASSFGTRTYQEKGSGLTFQAGYEYQYTFTGTNELNLTSVVVTEFLPGFSTTDGEEDAGNAT